MKSAIGKQLLPLRIKRIDSVPVDFLDRAHEEVNDAKPPSPIVWGLLLVIAIAAGVALTFYLWPKGRPARGWRFYGWFVVAPLAWALCFAARLHSYEIRVWRTQGHNSERTVTIEHNTTYTRRPLALLGYAYDTAMGRDKLAKQVIGGKSALGCRRPADSFRGAEPAQGRWRHAEADHGSRRPRLAGPDLVRSFQGTDAAIRSFRSANATTGE
ncbi:hypothetical protein FAZ95_29300 [Trinickia violacea]|uniref:Uncharacterized protein n=1 Tax=Trinickia violacea TaxID=2571746 RepID=A0A4P8IVJ0_9BURK|nr:hypothetical protein [Trinickia violacea]QCP53172.1 hypothetical protein FAZ95_29300 [Trinickia violacea]